MYFNTLDHLRQQMYGCFERSRDALFNVGDALLSESQARSLPELSLSVFFERSFPSVYEALQDGRINTERLRSVFVQALLEGKPTDEPIWLGIDSSSMQRLEADSSRDRGMIYVPNMPHATKPVSVGYQFSTVMLLPEQPSSWVGILEQRRIGTTQTAIEAMNEDFADIVLGPPIKRIEPTPEENEDNDQLGLHRIAFGFNRRDYGRLRQMIDVLNSL